jgi:hypothetical protein
VTLQEPRNPPIANVDMPDTEVIAVAHPSPVFVDSTGRRRRLLKRVAYGFSALCMVYGGLISVSLAGGPVSSSAVLPLPDLADGDEDDVLARPSPAPDPPIATPTRQPIVEVFPRRAGPAARTTEAGTATLRSTSATPQRSRTPSAGPTKPSTRPTTAKPIESGTTKPSTPESTPPTTETTTPVVPPVPPAGPTTGTGGGGGGGATDEDDDEPVDPPATHSPADDPTDTDTDTDADTDTDSQPKATTSKPEPEPEPRPEPNSEPKSEPEPELEIEIELGPEPEPSGEVTA